ncbi:MAG: sigma 54-interacting transcriptional regulator [Clostridiales bacterium]|nr:sigma 54-interacting transcriptional regulator [Clostridiales bacterium]
MLAPKKLIANDVLSKCFITVKSECKLDDAIEQMLKENLTEIFVVNTEDLLIGVLTLSDISRIKTKNSVGYHSLKTYLKEGCITINGSTSLLKCRDIMLNEKIGRLPVVDKGRIIGVVRSNEIRDSFYMEIEKFSLHLKSIIDSINEAVCVISLNGEVIVWNKNAEKLYGVDGDEIIGKRLKEYFPKAILLTVLKTRKKVDYLYHEPRKGSHIAISASPIYVDGKCVGIVSSERDITEVRALSDQLQKATDTVKFLESEVYRISRDGFGKIIGKSPNLIKSIEVAKQVARTEANILIVGESGTGKEVFARAIHTYSAREGLFVAVNCSAIPDELFESEFFGYEAGAFTGASKKGKLGIFELANNGTVFLDEIADLPMHMQAKLLRVLQEKEIRRVGGEKTCTINVRVISATNKDLNDMVSKETFRDDLFYRLNVIRINLPPIRERQGDVELLIHTFFKEISIQNHKPIPKFEDGVLDILKAYSWKGNVRELKNTVEHMVVLSPNNIITKEAIPEYIIEAVKKEKIRSYSGNDLTVAVEELERSMIVKALQTTNFNKAKTAKMLNLKRSTLYYKLEYYGLKKKIESKTSKN